MHDTLLELRDSTAWRCDVHSAYQRSRSDLALAVGKEWCLILVVSGLQVLQDNISFDSQDHSDSENGRNSKHCRSRALLNGGLYCQTFTYSNDTELMLRVAPVAGKPRWSTLITTRRSEADIPRPFRDEITFQITNEECGLATSNKYVFQKLTNRNDVWTWDRHREHIGPRKDHYGN